MKYADLRQAIIDYAENNDPEFAAHVDDFIRAAELRIFREVDLRAFRVQASSQLSQNDAFVLLPDDSDVIIRSFHIKDESGRRKLLLPKNYTFIEAFWPDRTQLGEPRYYAHWKINVVILAPTPQYNYYAEMEYSALPTSITDQVNAPSGTWLGDNGWTALLYGALIEAYSFMKGEAQAIGGGGVNAQGAGVWPQKFKEAMQDLAAQELRERIDDFRAQDPR